MDVLTLVLKEFAKSVFDELTGYYTDCNGRICIKKINHLDRALVPAAEQRLEPRDQHGPQTTAPQ